MSYRIPPPPSSSSSSSSPILISCGILMIGGLAASTIWLWKELESKQTHDTSMAKNWEQKRQEERTGRIRAEVKLRDALAKLKQQQHSNGRSTSSDDPYVMPLSTIGTIISPYPKRMGTPRQGALVPSSRGCIQFVPSLAPECLDGIDEYSHLWVIFQFHENTSLATSQKTKIRPPRGGGIKVGQLSTRSPHRPNALGLSLVTLDKWDPSTRRLHIKALDLVDGTPVYDVKPYVHWDIPNEVAYDISKLKLPKWVESKEDVLPNVIFEPEPANALKMLVQNDQLSPLLYPSKDPDSFQAAMDTLTEILAQDPRSSHRGLSKNQRGTLSSADGEGKSNNKNEGGSKTADDDKGGNIYRLLFGYATVEFVVEERGAVVTNIQLTNVS